MKAWIMVAALAVLCACTQVTKEAKDAAAAAKRAQYETHEAWKKLLIYTPPPKAQLAQRRYCYKQLADVVCYDSQQNTTSPLVAIQEGNPGRVIAGKIAYDEDTYALSPSYVAESVPPDHVTATPIGPAGGEIVTYGVQPAPHVQQRDLTPRPVGVDGECTGNSPFPCKESNYVPDAKVGK